MMDDAEDIEQIYLSINQERFSGGAGQPEIFLREIMDEIPCMLEDGLIKAAFSNDKELAPLGTLEMSLLHYYWFSPTEAGLKIWKAAEDSPRG